MAKESPASHKKLDILPVPKKKSGEEEAANGGGVKGQQLWQGQGENRSEYLMKIYVKI